ncbi:MAG TPA: redoxin domain-containing protein [Bryobacteraceae bacterium]|nr:redoxin domain-containing protein [Bryobacteraceae bacterium]
MKPWMTLLLLSGAVSGASLPQFSLADTGGVKHTDSELRKAPAVVLYFLTTDCPISNGYVPEMNRIAQDYEARGVRFYGVIADTDTPIDDVRKHVREFAYTFPILIDPNQVLVTFTDATTTPEAALIAPGGSLKYLGRIDNQYESFGKRRPQATQHDLRDALDAVLTGRIVAKASTPALGCSINRLNP